MNDLVILVPDKNTQFALQGALHRTHALGIRSLNWKILTHVGRDGGTRVGGAAVLALERANFRHALLIFDHEGSGAPDNQTSLDLEKAIDAQLASTWGSDGKAIVIAPEVDAWIWGNENVLREVLRWPLQENIRAWLQARGFEFDANGKPLRPKEALEKLVPIHRQPRSSALYEKICSRISLQNCTDAAFLRLRATLQNWFPADFAN